jgi:hypothetical protein
MPVNSDGRPATSLADMRRGWDGAAWPSEPLEREEMAHSEARV